MITNIPGLFAAGGENSAQPGPAAHGEALGEWVVDRIRETLCGAVRGHENLIQFESDRLFLRCLSCGHETRGWELNGTPPTLLCRRDTERLSIAHSRGLAARRAA